MSTKADITIIVKINAGQVPEVAIHGDWVKCNAHIAGQVPIAIMRERQRKLIALNKETQAKKVTPEVEANAR